MADDAAQAGPRRLQVDLGGQVALVTGASQGLGRAIAEALAAAGATVALVARSADKLAQVADGIRAAGGKAEAFPSDVSKAEDAQRVVDAVVETCGRLDILVNNAGVTRDTLLPRMSDEEWDTVLDTNLRGPFLFMRAASRPMMQQRYGRIINVASVSGLIGNPGQANYSASKAGLVGLTKTVAKELAGRKITVNAVAPGFIASEMTAALGPALLDEVHRLYEQNRGIHFALSGSSARKLRRAGANLLAGRALPLHMLPFAWPEYGRTWRIDQAVEWGTLPLVVSDPGHRAGTLAAYVDTYLKEEITAEALVRNLDPFVRVLHAAGLFNGQILNLENLARESEVKRTTVERYFQILEDTLPVSYTHLTLPTNREV